MAEPTAISDFGKAAWHRESTDDMFRTVCDLGLHAVASMSRRAPISRTLPGDRCRTCWPTSEEASQ